MIKLLNITKNLYMLENNYRSCILRTNKLINSDVNSKFCSKEYLFFSIIIEVPGLLNYPSGIRWRL
jgi:hypothetical protein